MLTLFRRVRQRFIESGSVTKYLLYAVGEILLVVIGILIALQVNNWNEERKDRARENVLKEQLALEFRRDLEQLQSKVTIRNQVLRSSVRLLNYIQSPLPVSEDSILYHLALSGYRPTFDPISVEFIDKSDLSLIQNKELKRLLTAWKVNVMQLSEDEEVWRNYVLDHRIPFLIRKNVTNPVTVEFMRNNASELFLIDINSPQPEVTLTEISRDIDYDELLNDPFLEDFLSLAVSINMDNNRNSKALEERITRILTLLEQ